MSTKILLKTYTFSNFYCIFSTVPQSLMESSSIFIQNFQIFNNIFSKCFTGIFISEIFSPSIKFLLMFWTAFLTSKSFPKYKIFSQFFISRFHFRNLFSKYTYYFLRIFCIAVSTYKPFHMYKIFCQCFILDFHDVFKNECELLTSCQDLESF